MNDLMTNSFTSYIDLRKAAMKDLEAGPDSDLEMASKTDENLSCFLEETEKVKARRETLSDPSSTKIIERERERVGERGRESESVSV